MKLKRDVTASWNEDEPQFGVFSVTWGPAVGLWSRPIAAAAGCSSGAGREVAAEAVPSPAARGCRERFARNGPETIPKTARPCSGRNSPVPAPGETARSLLREKQAGPCLGKNSPVPAREKQPSSCSGKTIQPLLPSPRCPPAARIAGATSPVLLLLVSSALQAGKGIPSEFTASSLSSHYPLSHNLPEKSQTFWLDPLPPTRAAAYQSLSMPYSEGGGCDTLCLGLWWHPQPHLGFPHLFYLRSLF